MILDLSKPIMAKIFDYDQWVYGDLGAEEGVESQVEAIDIGPVGVNNIWYNGGFRSMSFVFLPQEEAHNER